MSNSRTVSVSDVLRFHVSVREALKRLHDSATGVQERLYVSVSEVLKRLHVSVTRDTGEAPYQCH